MRRAIGLLALGLALFAAAVANGQPAPPAAPRSHLVEGGRSILLYPNERAILRVGGDGRLTLLGVSYISPERLLPPRPGPRGPENRGAWSEAPPGAIALMMGQVGADTLLKVESGIDKAFDYRAVMLLEGEGGPVQQPTSVCTVLPLLASYEQWERRHAGALVLGAFATRDTNEVVCPKPAPPAPAAVA